MSTQPPDHPSSSAIFNEIEQVEQDTNNPTQINREIDNPKEKRHKNSKKPKSIDTATNMEPRSNDGDNNKSNREAKAKAKAEAEAEAEALHKLIGADLSSIKNASERINKYEEPIKLVSDRFNKFKEKRGTADEYRELKKVVKKLKQQISSKHKDDDSDADRKLWSIDSTNITGADADKLLEEMPNLYKNEAFEKSLDFKEFKERYDELDLELKLCLLSFSVFPENVEIKKRVMLYWWIGEGFVPRKDTVANTAAASDTVPNALANTVANTASNTVPSTAANTVPNALANTVANTAPNTLPNTMANAAANTVPNALANTVANVAANMVPNALANTVASTAPNTVANAAANTVPSAVTNTVSNTAVQETNDKKTPEQFANEFFKKLIEKGFIQPVYKKRSVGVDICKMHPFVRSMVVKLAKKAKFFNFDDKGNATEDYSGSLRACLKGKGLKNFEELDKLHTLFNVNEAILDFKPEWFSKMKNLNVLYLGRWQTSPTHHIEVEDTAVLKTKNANVLDGLEDIRHLRFLSLQGISRVTELPESISKLSNLMILDIRACHNLEIIPDGFGSLKNLTHLDMSECYLLDQMPKGLSLLSKLQVLRGFVVGDSDVKNSCTLDDLRKLTELRKLSIHTGVDEFPKDRDLRALNQFKALTKLTIAWGRSSVEAKRDDKNNKDISSAEQPTETPHREGDRKKEISAADQAAATSKKLGPAKTIRRLTTSKFAEVSNPPELPSQLIKLDLQCFPGMITPSWLKACKLNSLKKLYIRGGKFSDLGQFQELDDEELEKDKWKVEELRLKYLTDLEMNWRELQELFPDLTYLEKVNCPKLTFFPCDESGVWMNKTMGG